MIIISKNRPIYPLKVCWNFHLIVRYLNKGGGSKLRTTVDLECFLKVWQKDKIQEIIQ